MALVTSLEAVVRTLSRVMLKMVWIDESVKEGLSELNNFEILFLVPSSGKDAPRPGASFPLGGICLSGRLGVVF